MATNQGRLRNNIIPRSGCLPGLAFLRRAPYETWIGYPHSMRELRLPMPTNHMLMSASCSCFIRMSPTIFHNFFHYHPWRTLSLPRKRMDGRNYMWICSRCTVHYPIGDFKIIIDEILFVQWAWKSWDSRKKKMLKVYRKTFKLKCKRVCLDFGPKNFQEQKYYALKDSTSDVFS